MGKKIELFGFPPKVTKEEVQNFVEEITGRGSICTIKTKHAKGRGRRVYAIIEFNTEKDAGRILSFSNKDFFFQNSYLKVQECQDDATFQQTFTELTLHFGCQISEEKFFLLHSEVNVSVDFGFVDRKIYFFISRYHVKYMLVLYYENIWRVELHRPHSLTAEYLLIQLVGAPRIYEKKPPYHGYVITDPFPDFSMHIDDTWVRSTDFTPSSSIGQSSSLCLEIPSGRRLPNLHKQFGYYKESKSKFVLDGGSTYSCDDILVPMVRPPLITNSTYEILFKINMLVQHGCLPGPSLDVSFYDLVDPRKEDIAFIEHALKKLYHLKECCYDPSRWLIKEYKEYRRSKNPPRSSVVAIKEGLVYVHRVQVSPSRVYFNGPEVNVSNRVIRNYPEDINNFLRVSFVDEELQKMYSTDLLPRSSSENMENMDRRTKIYDRILLVLGNGIVIGEKRFEFLAFSSSQLRENSTWMFASREGLTAADIRKWMGNFHHIQNVAKYAARLGQSFGSSTETLSVDRHEIEVIPDIEVTSGEFHFVFSDGIGKISAEFAKKVAVKCGIRTFTPSAFQIRYSGYKGVVAVDPNSSVKLSLRKSMSKYDSENTKLDVLFWSRYQPCFLNRQLITLLSTLGVEDHIFEVKQRQVVDELDKILTDPLKAQEVLELMSPGENTNVLKAMLSCGYQPRNEPFLSMMLTTFRASKLLDLRRKSRIFVPNGRAMIGCLDETAKLKYGEVFVQFSKCGKTQFNDDSIIVRGSRSNPRFIVKGKVVVAKNPCLHPGDVRILQAVNVPALHHMVDCVVFPQKGQRPHPNECSGSDLDGDIYFVSWDHDLIPPHQVEAMDYTPPPSEVLDHDVTMKEVHEYFANYMVNDSLGIIANAHTVFADKEAEKAMSSPCIQLAELFSVAVDFPKTGVPAIIPRHLYIKEYPDFMDKTNKETYRSNNVIGKLYRELVDIEPEEVQPFSMEVARYSYDPEMEVEGFEDYLDNAFYHKTKYDYRLGNLMDYYQIKTEAEFLTVSETAKSKSFTKKRDSESIINAIRSLRKEARNWFKEKGNGSRFERVNLYAKASAWYFVTYHPDYWGSYNEGKDHDHFLSFPWCIYDKLVHIKRGKSKERMSRRALHR